MDANFINIYIKDVKFIGVKFLKECFRVRDRIDISSEDDLPRFVGAKITDVDFNFADNIDENQFFDLCYHLEVKAVGIRSGGKDISIDDTRKYKTFPWSGVFVESDKSWSKQSVKKWVTVECAKRKLEQAEAGRIR